jgi:uncharacterized protein involved in exopolysaccharide biosynthesis
MKTTSERWSENQDALSFREILGFLGRQKAILLSCLVVGLLGWLAAILLIPTTYRVYSSFTVDARAANGAASNDAYNEFSFPDQVGDILTAIQVMQGEEVLGEAYRRQNIPVGRIGDQYVNGPKVVVNQAGYTNLVEVTVDWTNPDQALAIARDIPTLFAATARRSRDATLNQAITFLESRRDAAVKDVQRASDALAKFNASLASKTGSSEQIEMTSRRSQAVANSEAAKADLEGARERLASLQAASAAIPKTVRNPSSQSSTSRRVALTDELNQLRSELAERSVTLTPASPDIRALKAKIASKESSLRAIPPVEETTQVNRNPQLDVYADKVAEAEANVKAAEARFQKASEFLTIVQGQANTLESSLPERARLENNLDQAQKALELVNQRLEALQVRKNAIRDAVTVVAPAAVQDAPVQPRPLLYLAIAIVASLVLGVSLASLKEHLDDRVTTPELAARETGAVSLGVLPSIRGRERLCLTDPRMPRRMADAARLVHQRLETMYGLANIGELHSLMITSMSRTEDRSWVVRNLAAAYASEGKSVIIVSVGNTSVLETLGNYSAQLGYSDLLANPMNTEGALVDTDIQGVRAVTRGSSSAPLTSAHVALVHARLSELADIVIYDGPSYLFPFDVQSLGNVVDATAIVVKPGIPKRNLLGVASDTLRGLRSHFLGIMITGSAAEEVTKDIVRLDDETVA